MYRYENVYMYVVRVRHLAGLSIQLEWKPFDCEDRHIGCTGHCFLKVTLPDPTETKGMSVRGDGEGTGRGGGCGGGGDLIIVEKAW